MLGAPLEGGVHREEAGVNYNYSTDWNAIGSAIAAYAACFAIFAIAIVALQIVAYWKILNKAGYEGAWSLLVLVPGLGSLAGIGILLFLAFSEWPVLRRPAAGAVYMPAPMPYPATPPPPSYTSPTYTPPPAPMAQAAPPPPQPPAPPMAEPPASAAAPPMAEPSGEAPAPPAPPADPSA